MQNFCLAFSAFEAEDNVGIAMAYVSIVDDDVVVVALLFIYVWLAVCPLLWHVTRQRQKRQRQQMMMIASSDSSQRAGVSLLTPS